MAEHLTRRQLLRMGGGALAALSLPSCRAGGSGGAAAPQGSQAAQDIALTMGFGYAGRPGTMMQYFRDLRERLGAGERDVRLADIGEIDFQSLLPRLQAAHSAQDGPVLESWYQGFNTYQFSSPGFLEPLDAHVAEDVRGQWLFSGQIGGSTYIAPFLTSVLVLAAHTENLTAAGIELPERLESWDAFVEVLQQAKAAGITPLMLGAADAFGIERLTLAGSAAHMDSIDQVPRYWLGDGDVAEPVVSEWIRHAVQLRDEGLINADAANVTDVQALSRFEAGEAAFMLLQPSNLQDPGPLQVVPLWDGPGSLAPRAIVAGSGFEMTSYGANKEAAGRFLEFQHEPEQLALFWELTGNLPCNRNFDPSVLDPFNAAVWDLFGTDPSPFWWEEHITSTHIGIIFDIGPSIISGRGDANSLVQDYDARCAEARERNRPEAELLAQYLDAVGGA